MTAVRQSTAAIAPDDLCRAARDDQGDTIFAIDLGAEAALLRFCAEWSQSASFRLMAEGIEPEGRCFGGGEPAFRLMVDPIDGSRGLMHDKRSAWCLAAVAAEHGDETRMEHVFAAAMTELPTSRQSMSDRLWTTHDRPTEGLRTELSTGEEVKLRISPSQKPHLRHGFGTVCDYFQGGKEILGRLAERILRAEMGGWNPEKAEVFSDQYISTGGQLAEITLGRDRFVLDVRPLVYRFLGVESSLCCRPYDACTALVAVNAGVIVTNPDGSPFNPPLDVTTNLGFAAYANRDLANRLQPIVMTALRECGLL